MSSSSLHRYLAELFGTFVLVFVGLGSAVLAGPKIGDLGVALAFGLALLAMVYTIGPISGCHINPAVTVGLLLSKKMNSRDVAGYIVAQVVGAIVAAALVLIIAKGVPAGYDPGAAGFGANGYDTHSPGHYNLLAAFVVELVLTFVLVFTVLGATDIKAPVGFAGLGIGMALAIGNLVAIPVDNCSMNPVRSLAPALFVGGWALQQLWLFIVAPLIGAVIAAIVYQYLQAPVVPISAAEAQRALASQQAER